jgi:sugar transferase (PEP-CTERM system associated)
MPHMFRHYVPVRLLLRVSADAVVAFGSVYAGLALPFLGLPEVSPSWGWTLPAATVLTLASLMMLHLTGLYDLQERYGRRELFLRLFLGFAGAYLAMATLGFFIHALALGRLAVAVSFVVAVGGAFLLRVVEGYFTDESFTRRKVLLLGVGTVPELIKETIEAYHANYEIVGCVNGDPEKAGTDLNGLRILGSVGDLGWITKITRPNLVVVAMEERRGALPLPAILDCKLQGIQVEDWPTFYERVTGKIPIMRLRPSWLVFAEGFTKSHLTVVLKRAMDIVLSAIGIAVSLPWLPIIALAIKLDSPGPVFFRQERMGQNGRVFSLLKFRSMRIDTRRLGPTAEGRDPRVTRVGQLLRVTRLDEMPQLFNVLRGEMSMVGPRPEWVALVPEFQNTVPFYLHRLAVKPGITGWAQVRNSYGASVENTIEKLQYDLYYIKNHSLFLDILILLHTVQAVLFGRGH